MLLSVFYLIVDVWNLQKSSKWLIIIGSNAIFAYVVSHLFGNQLISIAGVLLDGLKQYIGNWDEAVSITGGFLVLFFILRYMYKNKIFIKI